MLRFHFDYLSPYAYIAHARLGPLAAAHGRAVELVPVVLAALLGAHGQLGPAEIPAKRTYVFKDVLRTAHHLGLPLLPPPAHPFNPLLALRVSSLPMDAATRERLVRGLFAATWGGGPGVEDPAVVARIAAEAGLDGPATVAAAATAKDRLREQTDAAIAAGVFGVPTVIVDGEPFWGYDSFSHIDRFLRGEDPIDEAAIARWSDLPATAGRRSRLT